MSSVDEHTNSCTVLVEPPEGKRPFGDMGVNLITILR